MPPFRGRVLLQAEGTTRWCRRRRRHVTGVPYSSPRAFDSVVICNDEDKATRIRAVRKPLSTTHPAWRETVIRPGVQKDGRTHRTLRNVDIMDGGDSFSPSSSRWIWSPSQPLTDAPCVR
ncbi:hypothetical protein GCM10012289_28860 [Nonomuraea cavernae]|uniref:Uncharacterized protein n=1 Tax=Nonomuraea cavernae TaxID=2045107 RepID=A0A917YZQ8_9ACTN|nr:hypothetical protein GCM10012289_28860 [Nonomuraea cavernae]